MPDKVQIAFYGTKDYRFRLQEEALKRRIDVQKLIQQAVEQFIEGKKEPSQDAPCVVPPKPYKDPEQARLHRLLDAILNAGSDHAKVIKASIEMCAFALFSAKGASADEIRVILDGFLRKLAREENDAIQKNDVEKLPKVG